MWCRSTAPRRDSGAPAEISVRLPDGATARLPVRRSARARRITLRLLERRGAIELVLPRRASLRAGRRFAEEKAGWIGARLAALPPPVRFVEGAEIAVMGAPLLLRAGAASRGGATRVGAILCVLGPPDEFAARVERWLRAEARRVIAPRVACKAEAAGARAGRIAIRDSETNWGSCSARGNLSFSWRLVMAPPYVLDYVVAHEVAHLVHLHHGPAFWRLVDSLTGARAAARRWLRANGAALKRHG